MESRGRIRGWLDRWLPPVCLVCGDPLCRSEDRVCDACWSRAPRQRAPRCRRCGIALADIGPAREPTHGARGARGARGATCIECRDWLPYLRIARAPFAMRGVASELVHLLKYGGWRELADEMGAVMAAEPLPKLVTAALAGVVPVPLSATRLRERGYNQAELLAASVARARDWPLLTDVLTRRRHTDRQARLAADNRAANVAGAFTVPVGARCLADSHLLLVDDVLTTAATAQECVRALCTAGARAVSVLTFARARPQLPEPGASPTTLSAGRSVF